MSTQHLAAPPFPWIPIAIILVSVAVLFGLVKWGIAYVKFLWNSAPSRHSSKHKSKSGKKKKKESSSDEESDSSDSSE